MISIHAPTRGATSTIRFSATWKKFQSTLPREERRTRRQTGRPGSNFNPRSHERSDSVGYFPIFRPEHFNPRSHERSDTTIVYPTDSEAISIHAPTRGATHTTGNNVNLYAFQSTLPREERPMRADRVSKTLLYFNPRSHERSDGYFAKWDLINDISIHAPTRGATLFYFMILRY